MKATNLMIGDWVSLSKGNWSESRQIELTDIEMIAESVYLAEPVPLTPEILEKNGFYYDEDRKAYLMGVIFRVKPERYGLFSFEICGCPYPLDTVHQLQHVLRICGIEKEIKL